MDSGQILAAIARSATSRGLYVLLVRSQQHIIRIIAQGSDALSAAGVARLWVVLAGVVPAGPRAHGCQFICEVVTARTDEQFFHL